MKRRTFISAVFVLFLAILGTATGQQLPPDRQPADAAGTWTIYTTGNDDGKTGTHTVEIIQNGSTLTGHFKGPFQSGGIEGTINARRIMFRTKTREVLTFRGMINGNAMSGTYGIRGHHGTFEGRRPD